LIEKLALKTFSHHRDYKLQWLSENEELFVDKQVLICFSIEKYVNKILFDVVPMEASHLLLGRPWQYDKDVVHNGVIKKISFVHKRQKVTLTLLSPSEICEDPIKMRVKKNKRKKKRKTKLMKRERKMKGEKRKKIVKL